MSYCIKHHYKPDFDSPDFNNEKNKKNSLVLFGFVLTLYI